MAGKAGSAPWPQPVVTFASLATVLVAGAILYLAQGVLIPIALAVLITFLLSPVVIRLQRFGLPKAAAVVSVVLLGFAVVGTIGAVVASQVSRLAVELPDRQTQIIDKIKSLKSVQEGERFERFGQLIERMRIEIAADAKAGDGGLFDWLGPIPVEVRPQENAITRTVGVLAPLAGPAATAGLVVVLVLFMLFKREDLRNRIVALSGRSHLAVTTKALDEAGRRIARYLLMQFVINVSYGLAAGIGLFLLGVPYAALWGTAAAVLRYIPYLGPAVGAALPIGYSVLTSSGWGQPAAAVALIVALELVSNNVMEPLLYGRNVGVSEVAVILSAVFWAWLWGPVGLMLATPLTACLVVAGRYVPALSALTRVLGDEPDLEPHVVYYQRLLAKDDDEAEDLFEEQADRHGLTAACERVIVPALELAKRDRLRGQIDADLEAFILDSVGDHLAETAAGDPDTEGGPTAPAAEPPLVFGYAVRGSEDEAAALVLARLLAGTAVRFELIGRSRLLSEVLAEVRERQPAGVCLVGLPPGGVTQARSLCKRFRASTPDLKIAVARWGGNVAERHAAALREQGASYVGRIPSESRGHVLSMARLQPAAEPPKVVAAV